MQYRNTTRLALAAALLMLPCATASAARARGPAAPPLVETVPDKAALDKAFEALKTYDWGQDRNLVQPISVAAIATRGDAAARKDIETRLAAVLKTEAPRDAKDFVCRELMVIGTAESVPALAGLLPDKDLSHMGRYALERIPAAEAAQALRDALPKVSGALKIGVIGSLGARRDEASVAALAPLLADADKAIACSAACAIGDIGSADAAKALGNVLKTAPDAVKPAVTDATLVCAERLLAAGKKTEALAVYKSLMGEEQSKQVRAAATRGMLSAAAKKD